MSAPYKIKLDNVRLSFPALFQREKHNDGNVGKFAATFLIHKDDQADLVKTIEDKIEKFLAEKNDGKPVKQGKLCFRDGDFEDYAGYEGHMAIKASNDRRFTIIGRDKSPIVEEDAVLYAGCYVNAIIELWFQDNKHGKRVNANLLGVQFRKDGEAFGAGDSNTTSEFDEMTDEEFEDDFE